MKSIKSSTAGRQDEIRTFCFFNRRVINLFAAFIISAGLSATSAVATTVQNLFVAVNTGTIYMFSGNGTKSTFASGLSGPFGVVCDSAGNLYVSTWGGGGIGAGSVYKYTPGGVQSTFASSLSEPTYMAFDGSGNLFISDYGDNKIYKVTSNGTKSTFSTGLYYPSGIVFDSAGDLFVADGYGNIHEYANNGGTLSTTPTTFTSGLTVIGEEADYFTLSFDSAGDLFAADYASGEIYEFVNNGGTLSSSPSDFASTTSPLGLAFDNMGDLFSGNQSHGGSVFEYVDNNGTLNTSPLTFASPLSAGVMGLAFQPQLCSGPATVQSLFAVAQSGTIYMYTRNGTKSTFTSGLGEPFGLAFDSASDLYVSTWGNGLSGSGNVYEYTPEGLKSTVASGLDEPTYMAFDSSGDLFISDYGDGKIDKITSGGTVSTFTSGLYYPSGIAFDSSGDLFVADGNGNIHEYANNGGTLSTTPTTFVSGLTVIGEESDYFTLSFDSAGDLFAADFASGEIYEFVDNSGTLSSSPSDFASTVSPLGLSFNSLGDLFSANSLHSGSITEYTNINGTLHSTPLYFYAENVGGGYRINDVAFQPVGPVPYWDGTFLSYDPSTFASIPFFSGPAYSQNNDAIYAMSGPDGSGSLYNGDSFAYGLLSNLDPTPIFQWDIGENSFDGDSFMPTPAVGNDGTVYFVTFDGGLCAFNPNGSLKWVCDAIASDGFSIAASPSIGVEGNIYVATDDGGGVFYCIDPDLGLPKWKLRLQDTTDMDASPLCTSNVIYDGDEAGEFHYMTPYGQEYTSTSYSGQGSIGSSSPAIIPGGLLCIGDGSGNLDIVDPIPPDLGGHGILQTCPLDGNTIGASPVIGPDGNAYVGTSGGNFFAIQLPVNGRTDPPAIIAEINLAGSFPSTAAVGSDSEVYVGTGNGSGGGGPGFLYSMHLQPVCGQQFPEQFVVDWRAEVPDGGFLGSPLVAQVGSNHSTNVVYDANLDGNVFAYFASAGPSTTTWSTFKGNNQRQASAGTLPIPPPQVWSVQFGSPTSQLGQTGKAAYGNSSSDFWTAEKVPNDSNPSYTLYNYADNSSPALSVTTSSTTGQYGADVPSSDDPFNDNLMDHYVYSQDPFTITISGLPTTPLNSALNNGQALYDVYVYAYGGQGSGFAHNSQMTISPTGIDPVSGGTDQTKTTSKTPPPNLNQFTEGSEYVVFHNVPVTLSDPLGAGVIQITVAADSNNPSVSIPLINGIQIVAKQ